MEKKNQIREEINDFPKVLPTYLLLAPNMALSATQ
jgi:hypothetical protein